MATSSKKDEKGVRGSAIMNERHEFRKGKMKNAGRKILDDTYAQKVFMIMIP